MAEDDKNAIRELLGAYCFHLDADRFDDMAGLFTEDGHGIRRSARAPAAPALWPRRAVSQPVRARAGHT